MAHLDLKPANILVTEDHQARVVDFGISRTLDPSADASLTQERALTRNYASPEQIVGGEETVASDVYSLGVVLYELLSGQRPSARSGGSPEEVFESLRQEPEPASARVDARAAEARATTRGGLVKALAGDLDAIVLKALRFEPAKRYGSVGRLAEDLERYLGGFPVKARPLGWAYRLRRRARRHATLATLLAAFGVTLVGLVSWIVLQSFEIRRERDRALSITSFLTDSFQLADPQRTQAGMIPARDILDRAVERLDRSLAEHPEGRAQIREAIGALYHQLGLYEEAAGQLRLAVEEKDASPAELAETLLQISQAELQLGRLEDAEATATESEALFRLGSTGAARAQAVRAAVASRQGQVDAAESLLEGALEVLEPSDERQATAMTLVQLSDVLTQKGQLERSESVAREAIERARVAYGPEHPEVGTALNRLVGALVARGRFEDAEEVAQEALELYRTSLPPDHPDIARATHELAYAVQQSGRLPEALELYREALAGLAQAVGEVHLDVATVRGNISRLLEAQGRFEEAEVEQYETLATLQQLFEDPHPQILLARSNLASLRQFQGDLRGAEAGFEPVLASFERLFGPDHPLVAMVLNNLGAVYEGLGRLDEAEQSLLRSRTIAEAVFGNTHPNLAVLINNQAVVAASAGDYERALSLHREAMATLPPPPVSPSTRAVILTQEGITQLERGQAREGQAALQEALDLGLENQLDALPNTFLTRAYLAAAHCQLGDCARARASLREVVDDPALPADPTVRGRCTLQLSRAELALGSYGEAERHAKLAYETFRAQLGEDHWRVAEARTVWARALIARGPKAQARRMLQASLVALQESVGEQARPLIETRQSLNGL